MDRPQVLILGCGYTGRRVAEQLLDEGYRLVLTTRRPEKLARLARRGAQVVRIEMLDPAAASPLDRLIEPSARVLHSIPVVTGPYGDFDPTPLILDVLGNRPTRVVYLSTTGVYGPARFVDESTPAAPPTERERLRITAERAVASGSWSWLVLRPAAIYGPGRGVHESIRLGRYSLAGDGGNYVSRIHVDDLSALVTAGLFSGLSGTYPVADLEPCTAKEMAEFCADLLGVSPPPPAGASEFHHTLRSDRRVDGRAVFRLLRVALRFPSYTTGVPASLELTPPNARTPRPPE